MPKDFGRNECSHGTHFSDETQASKASLCSQRTSFATRYLLPYLPEFLKKYPLIEMHLELAERMPDLEAENIDVLIGMSFSATGNVVQRPLALDMCYAPLRNI